VGTSTCSTNAAKTSVSVAASMVIDACTPRSVIAAMIVSSFQCPCGTDAASRTPRGDRPRRRVNLVVA
jgi:hypothetical protein